MILDFRVLGLVSMAVFVITAGLPVLSGSVDWQNSVSYTWSDTRRRFILVGLVMSLAVTAVCISLWFWLIPHYHLPVVTYLLMGLAYVAAMGVLWVPMRERPGEHSFRHIHFLGGATLATIAAVMMAIVLWFGVSVSYLSRIACVVAMLFAVCWPLLFLTSAKRAFLVLESFIALSSSAAIIFLLIG